MFTHKSLLCATGVLYCAGLMRKEHPGVALSVKTHHAIRSVLNHCKDTIERLLESGVLDEPDAELLLKVLHTAQIRSQHGVINCFTSVFRYTIDLWFLTDVFLLGFLWAHRKVNMGLLHICTDVCQSVKVLQYLLCCHR